MSLDVPPALAEPVTRVRPWWIAALALANLGLFMGYLAPLQVLLPQQVAEVAPQSKEEALAWVAGIGALVAMVGNPIAGALSDRTTSRYGRRRPWMLAGGLLGGAALAFLAFQTSVVWIAAGWCLAQAALNSLQAAATAAVPDHVPVRQRGEVSGWIGIPQTLGVVLGVVLVTVVVTTTTSGYLLIAAIIPLLVLPFVLTAPDPRLPYKPKFTLASFWISPREHPDFFWAWITRFLMNLGNSVVLLYLLYFLQDAVGYERLFPGEQVADGLLLLILIYTAFAVLTTVTAGIVSDRLGRRKTLVTVSGVISALPALALAFWPEWTVVMIGAGVLGVGFGVYMSVDNALVTQVLPAADGRAKDLGVINIASSGPQVVAPVIAGPIVAGLGGYPVLFLTSALLALLGASLVWKIRGVP
ncbi:MFS transporter [Nonomuraea sp. NPDC050328]|uniref:MFS transporter n=1 Tax=Nonomuraea sp. NPDC050328 TaxID=3364361 RepID=UPI003787869A